MKATRSSIVAVCEACLNLGAKKATVFLSRTLVVKATRRLKPYKRARTTELVLTIGAPNYAERQFIRACDKAGEPFPVRKVQLKWYPKK